MNFVAIDFETANYKRTSACAIGLAIIEKRKVVETFHALIKPEPFWFVPEFTELHGITAKDVKNAPTFDAIWPRIRKLIKGKTLVAHNAPFDRSVLKACLNFYDISFPQPGFACTCRMARAAFPKAVNHKLDTVCKRLKISLKDHHHAECDAIACAKAAIHMCEAHAVSLEDAELKPTDW